MFLALKRPFIVQPNNHVCTCLEKVDYIIRKREIIKPNLAHSLNFFIYIITTIFVQKNRVLKYFFLFMS